MVHAEKYHAKTLKGLETYLARELEDLGASAIRIVNRGVDFSGGRSLLYKVNLASRLALRVLLPVHKYHAGDEKSLYKGIQDINWSQFLDNSMTFAVDAVVFSRNFRNSHYVALKVKDAIADQFRDRTGSRPSVNVEDPDLLINVHITESTIRVSLDSSGGSLHKRGYRIRNYDAPLNEVLAAGLVKISGWKGERPLLDPMCGSGTIVIEAALIAADIPPGIFRKGFGFEHWKDFDLQLMKSVLDHLPHEKKELAPIFASDINPVAVTICREHIRKADLQKFIRIDIRDFFNSEQQDLPATIIMNPPYGERMDPGDLETLYSLIGTTLKHRFTGSDAWVLSANKKAIDHIGLKPASKTVLYNGALECQYLNYKTFKGTYRDFKNSIKVK